VRRACAPYRPTTCPAPEHPYPTPLKDVKAAYRAPVNQTGRADRIVLSVESAGSNLAGLGFDADSDVRPRLVASAAVTTPMLVIDLWLRTRRRTIGQSAGRQHGGREGENHG
jgi:acetyl esterase/lipase